MAKVSRTARLAALAALAVAAVACGGSDGGTTAEVATTTTTQVAAGGGSSAAPAPATSPAPTAAPTTAPATTAPATTAAASTAPAPAPAPSGLTLECLQGEWILDQGTTDRFISALVPFAPASVPTGSVSMRFDGARVTHFINIVVRFTVPTGAVEAPLDLRQVGTAAVAGDDLRISGVETTGGWGSFTGTVGGVSVDVPAPPVGELPTLAGGPASCRGDRFTLQYTSGVADVVAEFVRA